MGLSRLEVNLRRLLTKCELMIKSKHREDDRFPKYISSLDEMVLQLSTQLSEKPSEILMLDYIRRINILKENYGGAIKNQSEIENVAALGDAPVDNKLSERNELLGIRKRETNRTEDLDEIIQHHHNLQEKIAEDMLILTRNLKEQSQMANHIIKKDIAMASKSTQLSDQNFSKLKLESEKLEEHSKRAWKCWMWIMLAIVMVVFINMVLFMKVVKKSK